METLYHKAEIQSIYLKTIILEIQGPAELHVRSGQLTVEKETNITLTIPLEDISTIVCFGAGIRISTMAMAQLCNNKITMMII